MILKTANFKILHPYISSWFMTVILTWLAFSILDQEFQNLGIKPSILVLTHLTLGFGYLLTPSPSASLKTLEISVWSLAILLAFILPSVIIYRHSDDFKLCLRIAPAIFIFAFFILSLTRGLLRSFNDNDHIPVLVFYSIVVIATLPLWISPWAELIAQNATAFSVSLWCSPLTYFATFLDYDYLRGEWFYRNTPYGMMRYDYPHSLWNSAVYLVLALLLLTIKKPTNIHSKTKENQPYAS